MTPVVERKIVVVGDGTCGKTCLLVVFSRDEFPYEYIPTIFDTYVIDMAVDKKKIKLSLWDTAGQQDYDRLRPLTYPDTDAFLMCFAIDCPDTFTSVQEKWMPEIRHFCPKTPIVLVGMKKDLRNDGKTIDDLEKRRMKPISTAEGKELAENIAAFAYIECSAITNAGVREVFETAVRAAQFSVDQRKRERRKRLEAKCAIL